MGRPINKRFIGNTSLSGQQIQATAYIAGTPGPKTAWIRKQTATNTYDMAYEDGSARGRVSLVQGNVALNPGEANVVVRPYGSSGTGAVGSARMAASGSNVAIGGSGASFTNEYNIGQLLTLIGGSNTAPAIFNITQINAGNAGVVNAGFNYNVGNQITIGGAGYLSNILVNVSTVNAAGSITGVTVTAGSGLRSTAAPADPVSGSTLQGSSGNVNISGNGATFNIRWNVANVSVNSAGVFSVLPANPVATTSNGTGTGATLNVGWGVSNVVVTNGGSDFDTGAVVVFNPAGAAATTTVNAAGSITSVSVTNPGPAVTAVPTVTLQAPGQIEYANEIRNLTVRTFTGNSYSWVNSTQPLTASNQAQIQTS